ncbi:hypothetical protein [Pusillimonas sp.]|uniref:hypothetical protein n=1 Tax=Pusillimonas sp. TaxID=3040095 RepID=UPI0037C91623
MKHFITLSLATLALAWTVPGLAQQVSPAPEAATGSATLPGSSAATTGITGNDGSGADSDGADSRSDDTSTPDYEERKPTGKETGDKDDFSGNEGTDTESAGTDQGTSNKEKR